jgi:type IV secretion system protein VirB2
MQSLSHPTRDARFGSGAIDWKTLGRMALVAAIILPGLAMAQGSNTTATGTDAINTTCTFLSNVQNLLNAISIGVVTIAIIFAGYQIAFAHKRITDVAPILIGAVLIGAAGQIAKMFIGTQGQCSAGGGGTGGASITPDVIQYLASITHNITGYLA